MVMVVVIAAEEVDKPVYYITHAVLLWVYVPPHHMAVEGIRVGVGLDQPV